MHIKRFLTYILVAVFLTACGSPEPAAAATNAQSIQFLLSQVRNASGPLSGGKVYFYAAGTTTPKTIWLDRGKVTPAANPYTLGSNATAQLFGDGLYRVVLKTSAGVTIPGGDMDNLSFKDASGLAYDVADYASLAAAVAAIGSTPATLQYSTDQTLAANLTVPATLELMPLNGAVINHGAYTINCTGSTERWPLTQIFNGSGAVTGLSESRAVWFGAIATKAKLQLVLNSSKNVYLTESAEYTIEGTVNITASDTKIYGNNAKIIGAYEQSGTPTFAESCIYVNGADNVLIKDLRLEYTGTYDFGDYGGYISGIQVEESDGFVADNVEAYGWNRAGISVATFSATYSQNPKVVNCKLHNNRVAGLLYGNTENGIVSKNYLTFNGITTSASTGYGFAGWSASVPKNTTISENYATDNYRKGIDFHAGENGVVSGNYCLRNRVYGIYTMGVKGQWIITNNDVGEMTWGNEFPTVAPYGIRFGHLVGQGLSEIPTSFIVSHNTIHDMAKTAGDMFPLGESLVGCSYGSAIVSDNIVNVGVVSQLFHSANGVTGVAGNYFDIDISNNSFTATETTSTIAPIVARSGNSRQKIFSGNTINITTVGNTGGVYSYDTTSIANRSLTAIDNTINVPATAWSAVYDPINVKRVVGEVAANNIVNGAIWRDWNGYKYMFNGTAAPTSNFWVQGSLVWNNGVAAGTTLGWACTVAGSPGTWKAMANVAP